MRATEFILQLLDLIDNVDADKDTVNDYEEEATDSNSDPSQQYGNSPDPMLASSDAIMNTGNDLNKPKHPADIRVSTVALYPDAAYKGK